MTEKPTSQNPYTSSLWEAQYPAHAAAYRAPRAVPLYGLIRDAADRFSDRTAIIYGDMHLTYGECLDLVDRLAAGLTRIGVEQGDRVGYCMANHPVFVILYYALWKIGAVGVGLNPLYPADRLKFQADDAGLSFLVLSDDPEIVAKWTEHGGPIEGLTMIFSSAGDGDPRTPAANLPTEADNPVFRLSDLFDTSEFSPTIVIDPDTDLAALQYTGGTTGNPKGAMLTHANLFANVHQQHSWFDNLVAGDEGLLAAVPFSHIGGPSALMNFSVLMAGRIVIQPRFDPVDLLDRIDRGDITLLTIVPTMYVAVLQALADRKVDWSRVKMALTAAAPLPQAIRARFKAVSNIDVTNLYGMTETSPGLVYGLSDQGEDVEAVGLPLPDTHLEIRATEAPEERVPIGEIGEICVAGPQVMKGYWKRPDLAEACFVDGLFRTGDLGYVSDNGFVYLVDRLKDMIIAGGFNVYPSLVEDALMEHPAIAEAAVIGVPDDYRGETIKAFVVPKSGKILTLEGLKGDLQGRLSPFEIPRQLAIMDELPKTPAAKVSREALRAIHAAAASEDAG